MPPKNKLTGTNNPRSARYQFNYELEDNAGPRVNDQRIPGGAKYKKGGKMGMVPNPQQLKVGGKKIVTRGNTYETYEGTKELSQPEIEGGALFEDLGNLIDKAVGGKRRKNISLPNPQEQEDEIIEKKFTGKKNKKNGAGLFSDIGKVADVAVPLLAMGKEEKKEEKEVKGGGLFSDIGQGLDAVSSIIGMGKKKVKSPNGDVVVGGKMTKKKKSDLRKAVKQMNKELNAGSKKLLEQLKN